MPFYPSYYPQEITVEVMAAAAAPGRFDKNTLHAYVGSDPFAAKALPARVSPVESLGAYVVVTLNPASTALATREARCAAVQKIVGNLAAADGAWALHPYPITPYHPDYLTHLDLADSALKAHPRTSGGAAPLGLRVRAKGRLAERMMSQRARAEERAWDAVVEEVAVRDLVAPSSWTLHGSGGVPWIKEGWFHAYLLLAGSMRDKAARHLAEEAVARVTRGAVERPLDRASLERSLVGRLTAGCERAVAGYTIRREIFNNDYSAGVENVAVDSLAGMDSAIFLRTVKLKDFPWNGWLTVGVAGRPTAAWNPVAGFTDATGRLLWSALADPALFPEPYGEGWTENRVRLAGPPETGTIAVPKDAILPETGAGLLKPVGEGKTARAKLTYRVLTSSFHDGTRMTVADVLYALAFSYVWGAGSGPEHDPAVARATALMRDWLVGLKVLKVDTDVLRFGEVTMKYEVPVVEVYLARTLPEASQLAAVSPPWSPVPWHVLALLEQALRQGLGDLSAEGAKRRGGPWLDLVRDPKLRDRLAALVADLESRAFVPAPLTSLVTAREARQRWGMLRQFAAEHRHFLVSSGPYQLHAWSPDGAVLRVFRDFSYPLGVGSFNRYPIPLRGFVNRVEVRADRVEIHAEAERLERFAREYRIVAEPVGSPAAQKDKGIAVTCRYVAVAPDGAVLRQGNVDASGTGLFAVSRDGLPRGTTLLLAVEVNGNRINLHPRMVRLD